MYVPQLVVLAFGTISHIICGQVCSLVQCFNVFLQPKHQELRTIIDVCGCAMFGCDGMSFDALFGMFRTLCSRSIIVFTFFTNSKHSVLFVKKKHWTRAGEWESRIIGPFPWDAGEVILPNRVFGWEKNEKGAEDLREARRVRQEKDHSESETEGPVEQRRDRRAREKKEEEERATSLPRSTHVPHNTRSSRILHCRLYVPLRCRAVPT